MQVYVLDKNKIYAIYAKLTPFETQIKTL